MSDQTSFDAISQLSTQVQATVQATTDQQTANSNAMAATQQQIATLQATLSSQQAYDAKLTTWLLDLKKIQDDIASFSTPPANPTT